MKSIEYSLLTPVVSIAAVEEVCQKAKEKNASALTVPPLFVKKAKELLADQPIKISTVIGYPYGWSAIESKIAEIILAIIDGADELEIVVNMTALKNNDWQYLAKELNTLMTVIRKQQKFIHIIIESGLLSKDEITRCCDLYGAAGIDCMSLSTGATDSDPSFEIVRQVRSQLANAVKIRVNTANTDKETVALYYAAGADRIGILVK